MPDRLLSTVVVQHYRGGVVHVSASYPLAEGGMVMALVRPTAEQLGDAIAHVAAKVQADDVEALKREAERQDAAERRGAN